MKDPRLNEIAKMLLDGALGVKSGELIEIHGGISAKPLMKECMVEAHRRGVVPYVKIVDDELKRLSFGYIDPNNPQSADFAIDAELAWENAYWDKISAHIDIGTDENDAELSAVPSAAFQYYRGKRRALTEKIINDRRWVYLHWPTLADAQKASMCYDDFYEFFVNACLVDYDKMARDVEPLVELFDKTDRVRIVGPGTDLSFSIKGIPTVPCVGHMNIPDGEVYTAPVRDSVNGVIQYNTAAMRYGKKFPNPRLVFHNGHIDEATCDGDVKGFNDMLDADEGARYIGEFAIGINNAVTKPIGCTLYDEKIGGSFHLTPGASYDDAPNGNHSQLHLDIVCIQTAAFGGGEIWFDDVLIRKDGIFTLDSLKGLNP